MREQAKPVALIMRDHVRFENPRQSRRDFFRGFMARALGGASVLELAYHRAAWARGLARTSNAELFDIEKVADGVYFAVARAQAVMNCNAAIFVNSSDVLVVDTHSKPSAAAHSSRRSIRRLLPNPYAM